MEYLTQWEAAELLAEHLKGSPNQWFGFLTKNSRNQNDAGNYYKITTHVLNGKRAYTREALLEYVRVNRTSHSSCTKDKDTPLQEASDEIMSEIVLNILYENDGSFDLNSSSGINEVSEYAAYYYQLAGLKVTAAQIKRELKKRITAFKQLNIM